MDAAGVSNSVLAGAASPVGNVASNATVWNALEPVSMITIGEVFPDLLNCDHNHSPQCHIRRA